MRGNSGDPPRSLLLEVPSFSFAFSSRSLPAYREETDSMDSWKADGSGTSSGGTYRRIRMDNATTVKARSVPTLTIPASWETSMKKARSAAQVPVMIVPFTGTWVFLLTSEKKGGSSPSLDIAIRILGWSTRKREIGKIGNPVTGNAQKGSGRSDTCGRMDPIRVEQSARTAPAVITYLNLELDKG